MTDNTTERTAPLPCPFCGGITLPRCGCHLTCWRCGADGPDADSEDEADVVAAWNRRAVPAVVPDQQKEGLTMWARRFIRACRELGGKVLELDGSHVLIAIGDGRLWFANRSVVCAKD